MCRLLRESERTDAVISSINVMGCSEVHSRCTLQLPSLACQHTDAVTMMRSSVRHRRCVVSISAVEMPVGPSQAVSKRVGSSFSLRYRDACRVMNIARLLEPSRILLNYTFHWHRYFAEDEIQCTSQRFGYQEKWYRRTS
jgi:hypothetical protein